MHKFFAKTEYLGKKVISLPQCHSTNEEAQKLINSDDVQEGTTIITQYQTKGKGQRGNKWESESGKNIIFSTIIKPTFLSPKDQFNLHIIVTLAIYDVLFYLLGKSLKIKWPNDIMFKGSKLGGILIENTLHGNKIESSIIGIGININQTHFNVLNATSLKEATSEEYEINGLIEKILIALEKRYKELVHDSTSILRSLYTRRMFLHGKLSSFKKNQKTFEGTIVGVDSSGKLIIDDGDTRQLFDFKEIEYVD